MHDCCDVSVAFAFVLSAYGGIWATSDELSTYAQLLRLIPAESAVSNDCMQAVHYFDNYMSLSGETQLKKQLLNVFFGKGLRSELIADDRFLYRMLQCFKFARITQNIVKTELFHYCYGYEAESIKSTAYSICIPSSCINYNQTLLANWQAIVSDGRDQTPITAVTCVRSHSEKLWYQRVGPIICLFYMMVLIMIVSLATVYDYQRSNKTDDRFLQLFLCFSVRRNFPKILRPYRNGKKMITCMYGIRCITILWIVFGHSLSFVKPFIENVDEFKRDISGSFLNAWIVNYLLAVDTFFLLGGTVNAYGWFSKTDDAKIKPGWSSYGYWLRFYRHRLVRLWPAHFYTLLEVVFMSSLHPHQHWPELDPITQCSKYWWQNLLFISSLFSNSCMGWTWYISAEFIFYLISPLFLLTLQCSKIRGLLLCCAVIIASSVLRGYAMITYNMPPTQLGWVKPTIFTANFMQQFEQMYTKPQYRIGPYIVGLLLGHSLSFIKICPTQQNSKLRWAAAWLLSCIIGMLSVFGLFPILKGWKCPVYYVIYGAFHRLFFAISIAWIVYACHVGVGGFVNRFLSLPIFGSFSSISYTVYLCHMPIVFGSYYHLPFPYTYISKLPLLLSTVWCTIPSCILALQCSLLCEIPAVNVEKIFLHKKSET